MVNIKEHGGALILIKNKKTFNSRMGSLLKVNYSLTSNEDILRARFVTFINARHNWGDITWSLLDKTPTKQEHLNLNEAYNNSEEALKSLNETTSFIGNLAGIDGAIVITCGLQVIGFGAEILAQDPIDIPVYSIIDPIKDEKEELDINQFGMRHRSALRLCGATKEATVFVISQDGEISLCWNKDNQIMVKRGLNTTNVNMVLS